MMIMTMIIIIMLTIIIIDCAVSSVIEHIQFPIFMWLLTSHFCCTHHVNVQPDRTAPGLSCMSQ
jgi:hypothetical protein